jgi:hypothetical protein
MFIKELKMYVDYLKKEIQTISDTTTAAQIKKWNAFKNNLLEGIQYYETVFSETSFFILDKKLIYNELQKYKANLTALEINVLATA